MNHIYLANVVEVSTLRHRKVFDNIESAYREAVTYCYKNLLWFYEKYTKTSSGLEYYNAYAPNEKYVLQLQELVAQEKYETAYNFIRDYNKRNFGGKVSVILLMPEVVKLEINK